VAEHWGAAFDEVMEHPAAHPIVNSTSACAGRAIFDQDPTGVGHPVTHFFYHEGHPSTAASNRGEEAARGDRGAPASGAVRS
jgi:hypothetical protein